MTLGKNSKLILLNQFADRNVPRSQMANIEFKLTSKKIFLSALFFTSDLQGYPQLFILILAQGHLQFTEKNELFYW